MKRVSTAVAGVLASIFWWSSAGAIDTNIGPQWSGYYIGVTAGYVRGEARWTDEFGFTTGDFPGTGSALGFTGGRNWQNGRWVYGIEGDLSHVKMRAENNGFTCFPLSCVTDLSLLATLRGRVGYLFSPNLLFFGTAGLAAGELKHGNILFTSAKNIGLGFAAGAGVEARVAPQWTLKAEYVFVSLDGGEACSAALCLVGIDNDKFNTHLVRVGLNYHLQQGGAREFWIVPASHWTGFYAGVIFGYAHADTEWSDIFGFTSGRFNGNGGTGGLNFGFNWQTGRLVYGVEGDAAFAKIRAALDPACCFPAETQIDHLVTFRGRLGYLIMPNTLVYASGGIAAASMKFSVLGTQLGSAVKAGPAAGAGLEIQVLQGWTMKGEYLFMTFGSAQACSLFVCLGTLTSDFVDVHMFRFGINRYF